MRPKVFSRPQKKGAFGTLRHMAGSRPTSVVVLWALNVAALALFPTGLRSASLSQIVCIETPSLVFIFLKSACSVITF